MTVEFVPFEAGHLLQIEPQEAHRHLSGALLATAGGWTALHAGRAVGCGGLLPVTAHRSLVWAFIGAPPRRSWPRIHRQVQRVITNTFAAGIERIEMHVDAEFPAAIRWARILGFEEEARLRRALANRHDCLIMVRFQ